MEYKRGAQYIKSLDEETRIVTGIFAVHGNVDDGGDMSVNGSFAKRLEGARVRFLWNHNGYNPPIASILSIREVGREELPPKVLEKAPEATGGVEVTRQYYEGVPLAEWVFQAIVAGDVSEMSYAYEVHGYEIRGDEDKRIRVLTDVELFDISDVNWGMNPATAGVKAASALPFSEHSLMAATVIEEFAARAKDRADFRASEGRRLSEAVRARLEKVEAEIAEILKATRLVADEAEALNEYARFLHIISQ